VATILVDSNVLIDLFTKDNVWYEWSAQQIHQCAQKHFLAINPIIYAEISYRFSRVEALENVLSGAGIEKHALPWDAAFLAAKAHANYRKQGGKRTHTLPDFFIGAHAAIAGLTLLTRDTKRYARYFPTVKLIAP
jgi:predicted nucleic acid-binding protein